MLKLFPARLVHPNPASATLPCLPYWLLLYFSMDSSLNAVGGRGAERGEGPKGDYRRGCDLLDLEPRAWDCPVAIIAIVSAIHPVGGRADDPASISLAPGAKCVRCWRVLPEVGQQSGHPALCARCADAVESGLVCRAA